MELLKKLCETPGISGHEEKIRALVLKEITPLVDSVEVDRLGSVIGMRKGKGKERRKVMISAHMDEIGFLVSYVEKSGALKIIPVGGFDPRTLIARRVVVHCEKGDLYGVIGSKPIHLLKKEELNKLIEIEDLFVDLGLSGDEVKEKVKVGDPVTLDQELVEMGKCVSSKALDNRASVFIMIEALKKLKGVDLPVDVYAVATVQEEVGLRGARTASYAVEADIGIVVDVTLACDVPDPESSQRITNLGGGAAVKVLDGYVLCHPKLVKNLINIAEKQKIKYQVDMSHKGGTDGGEMQRAKSGAAVVGITLPTRYIHTTVEMAHSDDIRACVDLLVAFLKQADKVDVKL